MTVAELIGELRAYKMSDEVTSLKVTVKTERTTSKLDYSASRNKRIGL